MTFSEADTRSKLIDPAIHARGWTEELIRREETAGAIEIVGRKAQLAAIKKLSIALLQQAFNGEIQSCRTTR
jgi:type I restriction enzyme R subunit